MATGIEDNHGGNSHFAPAIFFGGVIYDCIKRGNKDEMQKLLNEAKKLYAHQDEFAKAIKTLEEALKKGKY
jgi:hypothetical protein